MPFRRALCCLLAGPFAADRIDTWVLGASIALPVVFLAGLALWHLAAYLRPRKRKAVRLSPEPPRRGMAEGAPAADDPERLRQACAAREDSLADLYLELAESCLRHGQPRQAAAAWDRVVQLCPGRRQAQVAQERLQQLGKEAGERPT